MIKSALENKFTGKGFVKMVLSPFHALYKARTLTNYTYGNDKLIPVYASADIKIYPYQIAVAMFVLRSFYQRGVILCDDGSLGKSYVRRIRVMLS